MFRLQRLAFLASKRPCQRVVTQRMAAFSDSITVSRFPDYRSLRLITWANGGEFE
jgi:hypothetical protein